MHSLLLQHDIASTERSLPSSPLISPDVVTHTNANSHHLHSSHGSNSSKDLPDLTRLLQKVGSSRSKHPYPAVKPTSPPTSSTASSSSSSSSSFSQPSTAPSSTPNPRHSPVIPTPIPQHHYQRPQLPHRTACSSLPAQFVFKKPEYNEEYQRTHFHHLTTDAKDSFLGWSDLRRFFVSDTSPSTSSSSSSNNDSSSHGKALEADVIGNQFRHDIESRYGRWGM